jgi:uncharacterized membrane protein
MQGPAWVEFFQRVPVHQHDNLVLMTMTGTEVILQSIVALEEEYVVVRGRTAGSQDAGRLLMLPYYKLDYVGFQRKVMEPEAQAMFGNSPTAAALPAPAAGTPAPVAAPAEAEQPQPALPPDATPKPGDQQAKKQAEPSKSILLARLRARLNGDGKPAAK